MLFVSPSTSFSWHVVPQLLLRQYILGYIQSESHQKTQAVEFIHYISY